MHENLHLLAAALTAAALWAHPGWRRRDVAGVACAGLMLVAMADVLVVRALAPPVWSGMLLAAALGLAALRSPRRRGRAEESGPGCAAMSDGLGLVAMAALLPLMHGIVPAGSDHSGHGVGGGMLVAVVVAVAGGHVAASVLTYLRDEPGRRVHHALMGGATALMAATAFA